MRGWRLILEHNTGVELNIIMNRWWTFGFFTILDKSPTELTVKGSAVEWLTPHLLSFVFKGEASTIIGPVMIFWSLEQGLRAAQNVFEFRQLELQAIEAILIVWATGLGSAFFCHVSKILIEPLIDFIIIKFILEILFSSREINPYPFN